MTEKYLVVISLDAVDSNDLNTLTILPNFSKLVNTGTLIKEVESVYPSLTYPAHATIVTGRYPKNHGIINNTLIENGSRNPNWYWYRKYIKGDTLFDLAEERGLKTASILWPVTGRSKITYSMPEICCTKPYHNQILMSAMAGKIRYQLKLEKKYGMLRRGIQQPYLDNFAIEAAKYTIKEYKPNLMLVHLVDVDSHKHNYGVKSNEVKESLLRQDRRLGEIIDTLKEMDIYEETTIVILGDHSQIDANKMVRLNLIFYKNKLININKKGDILNYKVIAKNCDGSTYIYLKDKNDIELRKKVECILNNIMTQNNSPIDFILNSKEALEFGADGNCDFLVEAKCGFYFIDEVLGEFIEEVKEYDIKVKAHRTKATHGYFPKKKNYRTFFLACGKGIKENQILERGRLIDHGPTLARMLGLNLKAADGIVREEFFEEEG